MTAAVNVIPASERLIFAMDVADTGEARAIGEELACRQLGDLARRSVPADEEQRLVDIARED